MRAAWIVLHHELEIERVRARDLLDVKLRVHALIGLGEIEIDRVAIDLEPEQFERALEHGAILEHAAAHVRDEAIDVQLVVLRLGPGIEPVAIDQDLRGIVLRDRVIGVVTRSE